MLRCSEGVAGQSLLALVRDAGDMADRAAYSAFHLRGSPSRALRARHYSLIIRDNGHGAELYNQRRDPAEQRNIAREHPRIVEDLRRELEALEQTLEQRAASFSPVEAPETLDAELTEQLRSLGYIK